MSKIEKLNKRYGNKVHHHGDCEIYRSKEFYGYVFCSCGLLHDLMVFSDDEIDEIYPDYYKDLKLQCPLFIG